ncbi:MAG: hypothetical protein WEF53_03005 [Bacteroidota bacterium]
MTSLKSIWAVVAGFLTVVILFFPFHRYALPRFRYQDAKKRHLHMLQMDVGPSL